MKLFYSIQYPLSASRFSLGLILGTAVFGGGGMSVALAADIIYSDQSPTGILQTTPSWSDAQHKDSLFAGTTVAPLSSGNKITVIHTNNIVNTVPSTVYGGLVQDGSSSSNVVNIINSDVYFYNVYGGYAKSNGGNVIVNNNKVFITDNSHIADHVYGGKVVASGTTGNATVSNNTVEIDKESSAHHGVWGGSVQGMANSLLENNHVRVNNNNFLDFIYASEGKSNNHVVLRGNKIEITDGIVYSNATGAIGQGKVVESYDNVIIIEDKDNLSTQVGSHGTMAVVGSSTSSLPGHTSHLTSTHNTIDIKGPDSASGNGLSILGGVYGSYDVAETNNDSTAINSGNNITISGTTFISGNILGGVAVGTTASSTNNTITLNGDGIQLVGFIAGGYAVNNQGLVTAWDQVVKGNTLNLNGFRGVIIYGLYNFETYNWTLPRDVINGDVLVDITENRPVNLGSTTTADRTTHNIYMTANGNRLNDGDEVTLISQTSGAWGKENYTIAQGQFVVYDATLEQKNEDGHPFVLTINGKANNKPSTPATPEPAPVAVERPITEAPVVEKPVAEKPVFHPAAARLNPQSKSYAEGRAAAVALVNQGGDLMSTTGINQIRSIVNANKDEINGSALSSFAIANGSSMRYKTGSHVDINSFSLAAGLATGMDFAAGHKAQFGVFFEYGKGNYNTYNSFTNYASVHGNGDNHYQGGGLFGRIEIAHTGLGRVNELLPDQADGLYAETSIRCGRVNNKFDVGHNANVLGSAVGSYRGSYHSKSNYIGGHLAGGYVMNFDDKQSLDTYLRYLWTHVNSNTVQIAGEPLHFDKSKSTRVQVGGRYTYGYNDYFKPYIGATYEYEFDGKAKAKAYEFDLDRPSQKGSTGIFDLGFRILPKRNDAALSIDVTGQGYVGKRQGGSGNVKLKYQF